MKKKTGVMNALLLMALAASTTMSAVLLANLGNLSKYPMIAETRPANVANGTEIGGLGKVNGESETISEITPGRQAAAAKPAKKAPTPHAVKVIPPAEEKTSPQATRAKEEEVIVSLQNSPLYRVTRNTTLVTKEGGQRIFLPQGTRIRVAGLSQSGKALVVSRNGNPDGFVPGWAIEEINDDGGITPSSYTAPGADRTPTSPQDADLFGSLPKPRISAGPYGGSIGLGPAYIYVGREGQVSGSFSR